MTLSDIQIKNGWRSIKLGEIVDLQQGLAINVKSKYLLVEKSNLPLLRITDLINKKEVQFVDEKLIPSQFIAEDDSLIYSRTGQVGLVFKNRKGVVHNNCFKIIPHDQIKKNFLYYVLQQESFYKTVNQIAQKAAQPDLTHTAFKSLEILLPKVETQENIAETLLAYDDLIDNNEKRVGILDSIIEKLYTEQFIKNPDQKKWESVELDSIAIVHRGKSYSSEDIKDTDGIPFVNLKCIVRYGGFRYDGLKAYSGSYKDSHVVKNGDIVMAVTDMTQERMIVARAARIPILDGGFGVISMDLVKIEPKEDTDKTWLYCFLRYSGFGDNLKKSANGANVLHLNPARISEYKLNVPPIEIQKSFSDTVENMLLLQEKLSVENRNLQQARDFLIPQLVGGRVEIK